MQLNHPNRSNAVESIYFSVLLGCSPAEQSNEHAASAAASQPELMETKMVAAPGQAALQILANE